MSFEAIQKRILDASLRLNRPVPELVAVSKTQPVEKMLGLYQKGQRVFGENYVQEIAEKKVELDAMNVQGFDFHFIGHLQTNKVKIILPLVTTIHSVDSLRLYEEIEKRAEALKKPVSIYFQINIDRENSKGGFLPEEIPSLADAIGSKTGRWVTPIGLMAIPDPEKSPSSAFQEMQNFAQKFGPILGSGLSMGMSEDFEIAMSYGASSLRIGTALFGARR